MKKKLLVVMLMVTMVMCSACVHFSFTKGGKSVKLTVPVGNGESVVVNIPGIDPEDTEITDKSIHVNDKDGVMFAIMVNEAFPQDLLDNYRQLAEEHPEMAKIASDTDESFVMEYDNGETQYLYTTMKKLSDKACVIVETERNEKKINKLMDSLTFEVVPTEGAEQPKEQPTETPEEKPAETPAETKPATGTQTFASLTYTIPAGYEEFAKDDVNKENTSGTVFYYNNDNQSIYIMAGEAYEEGLDPSGYYKDEHGAKEATIGSLNGLEYTEDDEYHFMFVKDGYRYSVNAESEADAKTVIESIK